MGLLTVWLHSHSGTQTIPHQESLLPSSGPLPPSHLLFRLIFLLPLAFGWHFCEGFCDVHLQHYVKINQSVLFKYLQAFVALGAIFKVTFKNHLQWKQQSWGKPNPLRSPSLVPVSALIAHNVGYIKDPDSQEQWRNNFTKLIFVLLLPLLAVIWISFF